MYSGCNKGCHLSSSPYSHYKSHERFERYARTCRKYIAAICAIATQSLDLAAFEGRIMSFMQRIVVAGAQCGDWGAQFDG
jgi:hypothetical protein